jgi:hypothetical protein
MHPVACIRRSKCLTHPPAQQRAGCRCPWTQIGRGTRQPCGSEEQLGPGQLGSYTATRGWSPAAIEEAAQALRGRGWLSGTDLTTAGQEARTSIEHDTDQQDAPVIAAIGDDLPRALAELETWGRACIDASAFPPDQFKRAAGYRQGQPKIQWHRRGRGGAGGSMPAGPVARAGVDQDPGGCPQTSRRCRRQPFGQAHRTAACRSPRDDARFVGIRMSGRIAAHRVLPCCALTVRPPAGGYPAGPSSVLASSA